MSTPAIRVLEVLPVYTPLGIRFWDPIFDKQVHTGLVVTARPLEAGRPVTRAYRTASGVFTFDHLPGMRGIENEGPERALGSSPPDRHPFVIEVNDVQDRYLPVVVRVDLPLTRRGTFLNHPVTSPHIGAPRGFHLFSAPTRVADTSVAVVRGEMFDLTTDTPAAHAMVQVRVPGARVRYGLADREGRFAVLFPYPTVEGFLGGSPPRGSRLPLEEQTWELVFEVYYEPRRQVSFAFSDHPEYLGLLQQEQAAIVPDLNRSPSGGAHEVFSWTRELRYERELFLETRGDPLRESLRRKLLVRSMDSSP